MAISNYMTATEQIKEAILSSQYKAAKQVNAVQLYLVLRRGRSWILIWKRRFSNYKYLIIKILSIRQP